MVSCRVRARQGKGSVGFTAPVVADAVGLLVDERASQSRRQALHGRPTMYERKPRKMLSGLPAHGRCRTLKELRHRTRYHNSWLGTIPPKDSNEAAQSVCLEITTTAKRATTKVENIIEAEIV